MGELEKRAAPKHNELIESLSNQSSQNEIIILLLDRLCTLKENQHDNDSAWRERWLAEKSSGNKKTLVQILLGCAALYLGVININKDNAIVNSVIEATVNLWGYLPW